ncbi:MAG: DciA family protein [Cyanobacteria bacterium J06555_3]
MRSQSLSSGQEAFCYLLPLTSYLLPTLHFNSVDKILAQLENQPGWEKFRAHRQLLKCWEQVVNQQTAQYTRPLYITRQILYVATSGAARAQELSFQRYTLLKRLNQQLTFDLKDIRFSSSGWHQKTYSHSEQPTLFTISDRHKSKSLLNPVAAAKQKDKKQEEVKTSPQDRAKEAVQLWLKAIKQRELVTVPCPSCNSPTATGELARWQMCHHCAAQKWSEEYRVPSFSKPE